MDGNKHLSSVNSGKSYIYIYKNTQQKGNIQRFTARKKYH